MTTYTPNDIVRTIRRSLAHNNRDKPLKPHQQYRRYIVGKYQAGGLWHRHAFVPRSFSLPFETNLLGIIMVQARTKMEALRIYRDIKHES